MKSYLFIITFILIFFAWCLGAFLCFMVDDKGYKNTTKEYIKYLGDSVVLRNKTYIITDYSVLNSNLTIDNGSTISVCQIDKFLKRK